MKNTKLPYDPPELDVYLYIVERGFANSPVNANAETFSEINDNGTSSTGGENYTGTWDDVPWS